MAPVKRRTMLEWAEAFGIDYAAFYRRAAQLGLISRARRSNAAVMLSRYQAEQCRPEKRGKPLRIVRATGKITALDWSEVDWSQQDVVIAEVMHCSRTAVAQKRAVLGMPRPKTHGKLRRCVMEDPRIDAELRRRDPYTSDLMLAKKLGTSEHRIAVRRVVLGIPARKQPPSRWSTLVDYRLVDQDLARIWKVASVGCYRPDHAGRVRPMFDWYGPGPRADYLRRMDDPLYASLYRAQLDAAKRYFRGTNRKRGA